MVDDDLLYSRGRFCSFVRICGSMGIFQDVEWVAFCRFYKGIHRVLGNWCRFLGIWGLECFGSYFFVINLNAVLSCMTFLLPGQKSNKKPLEKDSHTRAFSLHHESGFSSCTRLRLDSNHLLYNWEYFCKEKSKKKDGFLRPFWKYFWMLIIFLWLLR